MSRPSLARTLLSHLAVQGVDLGDSRPVAAGARVQPTLLGQPVVTLVLKGAAARLGGSDAASLGLATQGDLINFDAVMDPGETEHGLWLTAGLQLTGPAALLAARIDRNVLSEIARSSLQGRLARAHGQILGLARGRVIERVAALLADIHRFTGVNEVTLRQSDIASLLAVRRAGVSDACSELQDLGALKALRSVASQGLATPEQSAAS